MKSPTPVQPNDARRRGAVLLGVGMAACTALAADTNAPPAAAPAPMTPQEMFEGGTKSYNNWIELSTGGFLTSGSKAQFGQDRRSVSGPFGGVSDFHYQRDLDKATTLTADGRALFDEHDYRLTLGVTREKLGFARFSYKEFRTWYNANGGAVPSGGLWFPPSSDALALDRGELSFEAGLQLENAPSITFKYTHAFRDGDKDSTSWGHIAPSDKGLSPSSRDIDEHSDAFQLDAAHHIKATDLGVGLRYETGTLNDALEITQYPGVQNQRITDRQGTSYDLFSVHAFTETWIKKNLLFSTGYSFSDMDSDFTGSRVYGSDFDVPYAPTASQTALAYYALSGDSRLHEYVMNINLLWKPSPHWSITPSLRVQKEDTDSTFDALQTYGTDAPAPIGGSSSRDVLEVRERLDVRYTGVTNWVFSARGDWTEGEGNLYENGGTTNLTYLGTTIGVPPVRQQTDDRRSLQKYSFEARWYPARRVSVDFGGYYKSTRYNYDNNVDSTPNNSIGDRYPAYLVLQNLRTYDGNAGVTLKPWNNVTLRTRYEYQISKIDTAPDPVSGLSEAESSRMTAHILAQNVGWSPWSRLNLQAGVNYVLSTTRTPVSNFVPSGDAGAPVLSAQNDYWTVTFSPTFVVDDRTDLTLSYFYYRANDYHDNSSAGVAYGSGAEEHGVTATVVRRISERVRVILKGGYYRYRDALFDGQDNYEAYLLTSSLQYRF